MSKIGQLINNIHLYGNSKFYMEVPNTLSACVIEFLVDEEGNLQVTKSMERFSSSFWEGNATLEESIEVCKYTEENLDLAISPIVCNNLYRGKKTLTNKETAPKSNTDKAVNTLYQLVVAMLHLSNADLTRWLKTDKNGKENILLANASQNRTFQEVIPEIAHENVEAMIEVIYGRMVSIEMIWKRTQTIYSQEDFKAACELWGSLCDDEEIPEFLVLKHAKNDRKL